MLSKGKIVKRNMIKKIKIICFVLISLILLMGTEYNALQSAWAYKDILSANNHAYPLYPIIVIQLNDNSKDGLKARTMIYNETLNDWRINYQLLSKIQEDFDELTKIITDLKQATIYDCNTSFIPGSVYVLLSPRDLSLAGDVANNSIEFIHEHKETWWYIARISYEIIDLELFGKRIEQLDVSYLAFDTLNFIKKIKYENGTVEYTLDPNSYTIIDDAIIVNYTKRDNISATFYMYDYDSNNWTINSPFIEYFNETLNLLNEQYIFKNNDMRVLSNFTDYAFLQRDLKGKLNVYTATGANMTPIVNENTTIGDIESIIDIGTTDAFLRISYSHDNSIHYQYYHRDELFNEKWDNILQLYVLLYVIFSHSWFCENLSYSYYPNGAIGSSVSFPTLFLSISTLIIFSTIIYNNYTKRRYNTKACPKSSFY